MTHYQRALRDGTSTVGGERAHNFLASHPDGGIRDGINLRAAGWYLDHFTRNPVILWAHDYRTRPPIGRAVDMDVSNDGLRLAVVFDAKDAFAVEVERKYDEAFLNAVSVGWNWCDEDGRSIDFETWWTNTDEDLARDFYYDLLETSAVPVPADPNALLEREAAGMSTLRSWGFGPVETPGPDPKPTAPDRSLIEARKRLLIASATR